MANDLGIGQQDPFTANSQFNAISFLVRQMMARMETMKLVKVTTVHTDGEVAAAGTVDVLPLVSQIDGDGNVTPHGTVFGIPWFRLQGGQNAVIVDPQVGDIGYVTIADRDSSNVVRSKAQSAPGSFRRFSISDGVYVGGCLNATPTQYVALGSSGIQAISPTKVIAQVGSASLTLTPTSAILAFGTSNITLDAIAIHINGPVIFNGVAGGIAGTVDFGSSIVKTTGAAQVGSVASTGDVVGASHSLSNHVHGGVQTGGGSTGPAVG